MPENLIRQSNAGSLSATPSSNRVHIGIFGRRNAGKSSLINAVAGQDVAIVSDVPGTTTDPVSKAMELHGVGPVLLIDTPGLDDEGELGLSRVSRTLRVLERTDIAVVVIDPESPDLALEIELVKNIRSRGIPAVVAVNKTDATHLSREFPEEWKSLRKVFVSAKTGEGVPELLKTLSSIAKSDLDEEIPITAGLVVPGDTAVLVIPVDKEAPKGRLILPQVQTIRDILDRGGIAVAARTSELPSTLSVLSRNPAIVITDSQAFEQVSRIVPEDVPLTSFSILFARHKGDLRALAEGARALDTLIPGDKVLIAEACTHHPIEDDIGKVKIPTLITKKVGPGVEFSWCRGWDFPPDLDKYKVVIHCGGCMLNRRGMLSRIRRARSSGTNITNYGMTIAWALGILDRALKPLEGAGERLDLRLEP